MGTLFCTSVLANIASVDQRPELCQRLTKRLPGVSVADCRGSGLALTGATSRNGFPILARDIPPAAGGEGEEDKEPVRVILIGGIHGDELTSASIVFQWMRMIDAPTAQNFHWMVAPVLNPDGLMARKPQRVNANGVDLNRNFPTPGWKYDAPHYWAKRTRKDPRRYPGPVPLSEPESSWLMAEMERFQPHVIVSVHAPYGVLDFDGPTNPPKRFGRLWFQRVGVFPGSLGNYSGMHKNVPVVTIELPNAQAMPSKAEVRRIWRDMLNWIALNVPTQEQADEPPRFGFIPSASATPDPAPKPDAAKQPDAPKNVDVANKPDPSKG